ncbi:RNA polymerase sigma factor [Anaerohalosphaera lusitana]|uniref:RNA polymerase sigma factor n=1 Tax=Anaerohalosphaera lusitana TaxID=1936003 RepID=A0A1U9NJ71_9BACT|nr:sigma-70 family RNA polymerase sigma factor [Anaerohalosphaera lusitana]AQT67837.1 RNA polymerase sigma factor [Anaerohalosphaera lusitana]
MTDRNQQNHDITEASKASAYLRLFVTNQKRIQTYILMLVPNHNDADDIFQEVATVMWSKFDQFKPGTNFAAWGIKIAHNCVRAHYRKQSKQSKILEHDVLDIIANRTGELMDQQTDPQSRYVDALRKCLGKLDTKDRKIVQMRYEQGLPPQQIADRFSRNRMGIYRTLSRIHNVLVQCIRHRLVEENIT